MKAILLRSPGPPSQMMVGEVPVPQPAPGEIRVRVRAASLNPVDYKTAERGMADWKWPFVPGLDVAGEVDAVGDEAVRFQPGDRVFYHGSVRRGGGFAEFAVTPEHVVSRIPEGVTFAQAAALPTAGLTAYQALHRRVRVQPGQTILVQAAAGGVGGFACQLGAAAGLHVIGTGSAVNADYIRSLGADDFIDYHSEDVSWRVKEITQGRGADVILDTLNPSSATAGIQMLAFGGHLAAVAGLPDMTRYPGFFKAISLHEIALGAAYLHGSRENQMDLAFMGTELAAMVAAGKVSAMIAEEITLDRIPQALGRLAGRHVRGKIVALVG